MISSDVEDDTLNLEVYRGKKCELVIAIYSDDTFKFYPGNNLPKYTSKELEEILNATIPFCIRTAENNAADRQEFHEHAQEDIR
jgi:hypothetical protein